MQVLFQSSVENPSKIGLGIIPSPIEQFSNSDKSVPHMGWNSVELLDSAEKSDEGMDKKSHYYFVHSYRAIYDPAVYPEAAEWAHGVTQYGKEIFVASVRKDNVFGTQFHPEKSGEAGLRIISSWLSESEASRSAVPKTPRRAITPRSKDGLTRRIVACMDVRSNDAGDLVVTKGDQYDVRDMHLIACSRGKFDGQNPGFTPRTLSISSLWYLRRFNFKILFCTCRSKLHCRTLRTSR